MSSPTSRSNPTRIRDNQRRSRARRKERLQELEEQNRNCQLLGVEASAEIQAAARKVVEENKRLRALLSSRGISNQELEGYLTGKEDALPQDEGLVASRLDGLLANRRPCRSEKEGIIDRSSELSSRKRPTSLPVDNTSHFPQETISSTSQPSADLVEILALEPTPLTTTSSSTSSINISADNAFQNQDMALWPNHIPILSDEPSTVDVDISSCNFAASIITSMRHDLSVNQVKTEWGCAPDADCRMEGITVLEMMDRYTRDGESSLEIY